MADFRVITAGQMVELEDEKQIQERSFAEAAADATAQFLSGAIEGTTGLIGLVGDLNPFGGNLFRAATTGEMPITETLNRLTDPIRARDPQTAAERYARTLGQFAGPSGGTGLIGLGARAARRAVPGVISKFAAPRMIASDVAGGVGAQTMQEATGDTTLAPLIGGVLGGAGTSALTDTLTGAKSVLRGSSPIEIKGSAARALRETTDLSPAEIESAIAARPKDRLGSLMTTAELTDDAGMAQIEKTLATSDEPARIYSQRSTLRNEARDKMLDALTTSKGTSREALGTALMTKAGKVKEGMAEEASRLWEMIPRETEVWVDDLQASINQIQTAKKAGLPLKRDVRMLVEQIMGPEDTQTLSLSSGALQDIRSDTLSLLREAKLTPHERRVLTSIQQGIDKAMDASLRDVDYEMWEAARGITRETAETFARGTAGGALTEPLARPENVLKSAIKGDRRSVQELKKAIGDDTELLEEVKRGVLDMIPRDAQDHITPAKMKRFMEGNSGALQELFGEAHYRALSRVADDLKSEARVGSELAFRASKGGSVTSQRQTVAGAIHDISVGSVIPGSGPVGRLAAVLKKGTDFEDTKRINEMLFEAAMDPEVALELAKTPTTKRVMNGMERLIDGIVNVGVTSGREAALEQGRPAPVGAQEPERKPKGFLVRNTEPGLQQRPLEVLLDAVKEVESGGNPNAVSKAGAKGPYQFTDATAEDYGVEDVFDEVQARSGAMAKILDDYEYFGGDMELALAAYNAGRGKVEKTLKSKEGNSFEDIKSYLPKETQKYVPKVASIFARLLSGGS